MKTFAIGLVLGIVMGLAACAAPLAAPTEAPTPPPPTLTSTSAPVATAVPLATAISAGTATAAPTTTSTSAPTATEAPAITDTPGPVVITYQDFKITPGETTIKVGTRVIFKIRAGLFSFHQPYNNVAPDVFEAPARLGEGATYAYTFQQPGTITLLCGYHTNMQAKLIITP